jgi:hypothetical protein
VTEEKARKEKSPTPTTVSEQRIWENVFSAKFHFSHDAKQSKELADLAIVELRKLYTGKTHTMCCEPLGVGLFGPISCIKTVGHDGPCSGDLRDLGGTK